MNTPTPGAHKRKPSSLGSGLLLPGSVPSTPHPLANSFTASNIPESLQADTPVRGGATEDEYGLIAAPKERKRRKPKDDDDDEDEDMDDDEDDDGIVMSRGVGESDKAKERFLLDSFTTEQMIRYEIYRRSNLNKSGLKKIANAALGQSITPNVAIVIGGFSKVFVGEIVELALQIRGEGTGPLSPDSLREAYRRYKADRLVMPQASSRGRRMFR
ncbi:TAFII28-domain-containing protein [Saitoella complicata NRRL Y-17804]|nr:TAFII28-domain-containing protein [Saitoella complicata NRRL Y-17804]ODQ55098.1 TAFII28-domain-containing protein [Saitoella complicata NRRL Y-17804]